MRRGDTRERIQQVALELFTERGYDKTSLREVADRLEITRPALYYHFRTKEDILAGVVGDLVASVDELTEWAAAQPDTPAAHREIIDRIGGLLAGSWRPLMRFAQTNQAAMRELPVAGQIQRRMLALISVLERPGDDAVRRFERRLAIISVMLGSMSMSGLFGGPDDTADYSVVSRDVASRLVDPPAPA